MPGVVRIIVVGVLVPVGLVVIVVVYLFVLPLVFFIIVRPGSSAVCEPKVGKAPPGGRWVRPSSGRRPFATSSSSTIAAAAATSSCLCCPLAALLEDERGPAGTPAEVAVVVWREGEIPDNGLGRRGGSGLEGAWGEGHSGRCCLAIKKGVAGGGGGRRDGRRRRVGLLLLLRVNVGRARPTAACRGRERSAARGLWPRRGRYREAGVRRRGG